MGKLKQLFLLLLVMCALTSLSPAFATEQGEIDTAGDSFVGTLPERLTETISGTCGTDTQATNISWALTPDGTLTISGRGAMTADTPWQQYWADVQSANIEEGVTSIYAFSFVNFSNLTSVSIPATMSYIGNSAFSGCTSISDVYYNGSAAQWNQIRIGTDNNWLTSANIHYTDAIAAGTCGDNLVWALNGDGTLTISGRGAMTADTPWQQYWADVQSANIEEGVTSIYAFSFVNFPNLTSVSIPTTMSYIGNSAFGLCTGLTDVYYAGSAEQWNNIAIGANNEYLTSANIHCATVLNGLVMDANGVVWYYVDGVVQTNYVGLVEYYGSWYYVENGTVNFDYTGITYFNGTFFYVTNGTLNSAYTGLVEFYDSWYYVENGAVNFGFTGITYFNGTFFYVENGVVNLSFTGIVDFCSTQYYVERGMINFDYTGLIEYNGIKYLVHKGVVTSTSNIVASGNCGDNGNNVTWTLTIEGVLTISGNGRMKNYHNNSNYCAPWAPWVYNTFIKEVIVEYGVTHIGDYAFQGCRALENVVLPNSVISIGTYAFWICSSLKRIEIPASVTSIDLWQFRNCPQLDEIVVDANNAAFCSVNGVLFDKLGATLIYYPEGKPAVYRIPEGIAMVAKNAFGSRSMEIVSFPSTIVSIGDAGYAGSIYYNGTAEQWLHVSKPEWLCSASVTFNSIGFSSFGNGLLWGLTNNTLTVRGEGDMTSAPWQEYWNSVTSAKIESGVTSIYSYAFDGFSNLRNLFISDTVTSIEEGAFAGCSSLTDVYFAGTPAQWNAIMLGSNNAWLTSANIHFNVVDFDTCGDNLVWDLNGDGTLSIRGSGDMTSTPWQQYWDQISSARIDSGVTSIYDFAFNGLSRLTSIFIPDTVTTIGQEAFVGCYNLRAFDLDSANTAFTVVDGVLYTADMTTLVAYPAGKWETLFVFPGSVTTVRDGAFSYYLNLETIYYPGSWDDWNAIAVGTNNTFFDVTIYYDVLAHGACGDELCWRLDNYGHLAIFGSGDMYDFEAGTAPWSQYSNVIRFVNIESGVASIGDYAFCKCTALLNISIPSGVYSIGEGAFAGCSALNAVSMPKSVTYLGDSAFVGCSALNTVTLSTGLSSIGNFTFMGCSALTEISIPKNVTYIGQAAFYGCSSLTEITIPQRVTFIGEEAFADSFNLEAVKVASGNAKYNSVGGVLYSKDGKTLICYPAGKQDVSFTIPEGVTTLSVSAFSGCSALTELYIPKSVTSIGANAFSGCTTLTDVYFDGSAAEWDAVAGSELLDFANVYVIVLNGLVEDSNGTFWYYIDGVLQSQYTGLIYFNEIYYYVENGALNTDFVGFVEIPGTWYYVENGEINWEFTGMVNFHGIMFFAVEGVLRTDYTGLVEFDGGWYYVVNGVLHSAYTGLVYHNDLYFYMKDGVLDFSFTGLVFHDDVWYYVQGGVLDFSFTGLVLHNDLYFYVENGALNFGFTGLVYHNGLYFYVEGGVLNTNYAGLVYHNGVYFYVENGTLNLSFTGLTEYYGTWYYVEGGILNTGYTGLVLHAGVYFYVENGAVNFTYTGLVLHNGIYFYVENGLLNTNFSGLTYFNGMFFYVEGGVLNTTYMGLVNLFGTWYFVQNGIIDFNYYGTAYTPNGILYNVIGGVAYP